MALIHLPVAQHATIPWKNGLGMSQVIAGEPQDARYDTLLWQVGSTAFNMDCPFSELTGLDRIFMVIDGPGVELTCIDDDDSTRMARVEPLRPYAFKGDWKTTCRRLGGAVRVLNVVTRRGQAEATVEFTQERTLKKAKDETLVAVRLDNLDVWLLSDASVIAELPPSAGHVMVARIRMI